VREGLLWSAAGALTCGLPLAETLSAGEGHVRAPAALKSATPMNQPTIRRAILVLLLAITACSAHAAAPPVMEPPDSALERTIQDKTSQLAAALTALGARQVADDRLVDAEVFHKAAVWVTTQKEWYKDYAKWTPMVLDRGLKRAAQLAAGDAPWQRQPGHVVRAYRSAIDGSVQPYAVILPKDYPGDSKKWRLDLILHGRDDTLAEVKFIHQSDTDAAAPDQAYVELHVYGRGNNGYRWAGERDAFEALDAFTASERKTHGRSTIDPDRIVLRGFSMGGAGAWHLGLHYPSAWCSCSPGAGFTSTFGLSKEKPGPLPDYIAKCIASYDAVEYSENVFDVPTVAYGGEIDPQLEASKEIEAVVKPMGLPATFLVGPGMAHKYHPDSLKAIMLLQRQHAELGRPPYPPQVRFVTRTPRYGHCYWVDVLRQEHQYDRSLVDAHWLNEAGYQVKTENVQTLQLTLPADWVGRKEVPIQIDGKKVAALLSAPGDRAVMLLEKSPAGWAEIDPAKWSADALEGRWKTPGLTGPIDDAFTGPFLCVRGTGKPWNQAAAKYIDADLARFGQEWSKWMRGQLPMKDDTTITEDDLQHKNLVLFGDPASNALIAKALPHLPLKWTKNEIVLGGETFSPANHVPAMIFPSPFASGGVARYVVLNSGHTFHTPQFKDTNRMLYPRLGDFAVLKVGISDSDPIAMEVAKAGLFDEQWQTAGK
jgi:predicted esterase